MKRAHFISGFSAILAVSLFIASPASAKTVKACEEDWKANKADIQASGKKKKDFMAECRAETASNETNAAATGNAPQTKEPASPAKPENSAAEARPRFAKTIKACTAEWTANKEALQASGKTRADFITQCRTGSDSAAAATPAPAAHKTVRACEEEWKENKAAIQASGKRKTDFIAQCRAEPSSTASATTPAPVPASKPEAAPKSASEPAPDTQPTREATNSPAPASRGTPEAAPSSRTPSLAAGEFTTEAEAKNHCPQDTVVWANTRSKIYHYASSHRYGHTKIGAYMCEKETAAAGMRAAKREKRS